MKTIGKYTLVILLVMAVVISSGMDGFAQKNPVIKKGDHFPGITFPVPPGKADRDYLGVGGKETFAASDVVADVLLVEIMNINCGSCQQQAPVDNYLFSLIEATPKASGRIKMMAVSAGTLYRDIQDFKDYFKTPYPVIEDPNFVLYDAVGKTPTPFAIVLVRNDEGKLSLVADTHKGTRFNYKKTLTELQALLNEKASVIQKAGEAIEDSWVKAEPVLPEEELVERIKEAFEEEGEGLSEFKPLQVQTVGTVYTGLTNQGGKGKRLFAMPVSSPVPCDVCHDVHFFYLFDVSGKIRSFIPIQLTKYGNDPLNEKDIEKLRERIVGHYIFERFDYDLKVDAVSAATITSSVVYKNIQDGKAVYDALVKEGLIEEK